MNTNQVHEISLISILFSGLIFYFLPVDPYDDYELSVIRKPHFYEVLIKPFYVMKSISKYDLTLITASVLILNLVGGIIAMLVVSEKISGNERLIEIVTNISLLSMVITQIGGWFLQACLVYMFSFIIGGDGSFNKYLMIVGIGYTGFMILSYILIGVNIIIFPNEIGLNEFNETTANSSIHMILGKAGEYYTLTLIAAGVYNLERRFSLFKCTIISVAPSFLLLLFKQLFGMIF